MRRCHLNLFFYFIVWRPFCSAAQNHFSGFDFSGFDKGSPKKHFCEIILKPSQWSIFSSGAYFVEGNGTIFVMQGTLNYFFASSFSIFSFGDHFVQQSKTILATYVKGHPRIMSVKLFWNLTIGLRGYII